MSASKTSPELLASRHHPVTATLMTQKTLSKSVSGTRHKWLKDGMPEVASRKLLLLNWIAFCLVQRSVGQTIAASLITHAGSNTATFLLSTNEPLAQDLLAYSSAFVTSLQTVFLRQVARMASGKEAMDDADIRLMMEVVVAHAPERILRKLERLTCCTTWGGGNVKSHLDRMFTLWETQRESSSPETANYTRQSVMDDYDAIIACARLPQLEGQARNAAFQVAQMSAKRLISSRFIKESCRLTLDREDARFILKFNRRLWRFRFYSFGAEHVLQGSYSETMRQLCRTGWTLEHTWLPTRGELKVTIPVDRYSYITSLLARKGYRATPEILDKWLAPDKVWQAGVANVCRLHPEMLVMQYLLHDEGYSRNEPVGTSKRPCLMCHYCIEHGYKAAKRPFTLTASSRRIVTDWLSPVLVGTGGPVDLGIRKYVSDVEENVVIQFRQARGEAEDAIDRSPNYDFNPSM